MSMAPPNDTSCSRLISVLPHIALLHIYVVDSGIRCHGAIIIHDDEKEYVVNIVERVSYFWKFLDTNICAVYLECSNSCIPSPFAFVCNKSLACNFSYKAQYEMTTQESQFECDVNIHFVVPDDQESENDCSEEMWQAFNVRIYF